MKKILLIALVGAGLLLKVHAQSSTVSLPVTPGTDTNMFNGSALVQNILWTSTAGSGTNSFITLVDSPTNSLVYVQPAITNIYSYGTNVVTTYTNYYGVVTSLTNFSLIDTTNIIAASTNSYKTITVAAPGGTSVYVNNPNWIVQYGLWATNTGAATQSGTITVTYQPR